MNRLRLLLIALGIIVLGVLFARPVLATIVTQQAQIGITIIVNVTPSPMPSTAYVPQRAPGSASSAIVADMSLRAAPNSLQHIFRADSLHFMGSPEVIAQAQVQHGLLVQAEVTPNPNATLLQSDDSTGTVPLNNVTINAVAGTTVQLPCPFTVTVDSTKNWQLDEGLSNDFATAWTGKDLANNSYVSSATPRPTATPYIVYADDGSVWSLLGTGAKETTYCVGLTLTVPASISGGTYSTNAVYTLFF